MFLKGGKGETNRYWKYFITYKNKQSRFKGESEKTHKQSCKRLKKAAITSYSLHYCLEVHLSFLAFHIGMTSDAWQRVL
jgi:hypothetical protein